MYKKLNCKECWIQPERTSWEGWQRTEGIDSLSCPKCYKETNTFGWARRPVKQWNTMNK